MTTVELIKMGILAVLLCLLVWAVHHNGRTVERAVWVAKENKELIDIQAQLKIANERNASLAAQNLKLNSEVTANAAKQMEKASVDDAAMRRDPVGLRIPRETCRPATQPAATGSASVDNTDGRTGGVRLPTGIETGLYDLTYRANKVRIKRDECREFAIGIQAQRETWEKEQALVTDN